MKCVGTFFFKSINPLNYFNIKLNYVSKISWFWPETYFFSQLSSVLGIILKS